MHVIKRLFLLPITLLSLVGAKPVRAAQEIFYLDDIYAEPAHTTKSWKSQIYMHAHSSKGNGYKGEITLNLYNNIYRNGIELKTREFTSYREYPSIEYDSLYFVSGRNQLEIVFHQSSTETKTYNFLTYIDDAKNQPLNLNKLGSEIYQEQRLIHFDVARNLVERTNHIYHFYDLPQTVYLDYYSGFNLDFIQMEEVFTTISVQPYYSSILLHVPLYYDIFIDTNSTDTRRGYVQLYARPTLNSDGRYHFVITDKLYVNPLTLEMRRTKQDGFIQTSKIYLPRNGQKDVESFRFEIEGTLGYMCKRIQYEFGVNSMMNFVGDCTTSRFCVETHATKYVDEGKILKND